MAKSAAEMLKFNIIFLTFGDASAPPARAEELSLEGYGMGAEWARNGCGMGVEWVRDGGRMGARWVRDECLMEKMDGEANLKITKKIALGAIMGRNWIFFLIFANLNK